METWGDHILPGWLSAALFVLILVFKENQEVIETNGSVHKLEVKLYGFRKKSPLERIETSQMDFDCLIFFTHL